MPNKLAKKNPEPSPPDPHKPKFEKVTHRSGSMTWTHSLFQWSDLMIAAWKAGHQPELPKEKLDS